MFGSKKRNNEIEAFLGRGSSFKGNLNFEGSIRIDGDFDGEIVGTGTLVIGAGAQIKADIDVSSLYISGDVIGTIDVKEKIKIFATGRLFGNIKTSSIAIEEGGIFEGYSRMVSDASGAHIGMESRSGSLSDHLKK
jgi:cytoskeletal protein CcmA (bactofilin family)